MRNKHPFISQTQPLNSSSPGTVASQPKTTHGSKVHPTLTTFITLQGKCAPGRAETFALLITKMTAIDMMPAYTIDGKGFRKHMNILEPKYKVPSHQKGM